MVKKYVEVFYPNKIKSVSLEVISENQLASLPFIGAIGFRFYEMEVLYDGTNYYYSRAFNIGPMIYYGERNIIPNIDRDYVEIAGLIYLLNETDITYEEFTNREQLKLTLS